MTDPTGDPFDTGFLEKVLAESLPREARDFPRSPAGRVYTELLLPAATSLARMREEDAMSVKAYVIFTNNALPWRDETVVYVVRDAEPRHVVPLLVAAKAAVRQEGRSWPAAAVMPVLAATHLIAQAPQAVLPHSRLLACWAKNGHLEGIYSPFEQMKDVYRPSAVPEMIRVSYLYSVRCQQQLRIQPSGNVDWVPEWRVEVQRGTARAGLLNPCGEIGEKGEDLEWEYRVLHEEQPLADLAAAVERLVNFTELGGSTEGC